MKKKRSIHKKAEFIKKVGENIKAFRTRQGISQAQLAFEASIPREQVGRIERGQINTSIKTLLAIAEALDTTPDVLIKV